MEPLLSVVKMPLFLPMTSPLDVVTLNCAPDNGLPLSASFFKNHKRAHRLVLEMHFVCSTICTNFNGLRFCIAGISFRLQCAQLLHNCLVSDLESGFRHHLFVVYIPLLFPTTVPSPVVTWKVALDNGLLVKASTFVMSRDP